MNAISDIIVPGDNGALVIFNKTYSPSDLFKPGACDPLIDKIKEEIRKEITDPSTEEGRKYIKSLAFKVTKSKTAIEAARVSLVSDEKKRLSAIDAEGKRIKEILEAFADEVKQPVTDFENREKDRISSHEVSLSSLKELAVFSSLNGDLYAPDTATIAARLAAVKAFDISGFEEFQTIAAGTKAQLMEALLSSLEASEKADAERAELARLRAESEKRAREDREAEIATKAKAEAEEAAQSREQEIARQQAETIARVEREKQEAVDRAAQAESDRIAQANRAEQDRIVAEKRADDAKAAAEAEAKRREEIAAQRERDRLEADRQAEAEATAKRERDRAHKARINGEVLKALMASQTVPLTEAAAKALIASIAKGEIPHTRISY